MSEGLLWFDNDPGRPIAAKVADAAARFVEKFGTTPNLCYVSHRSLDGDTVVPFGAGQIKIQPASNILVNHFWVGIDGG